MRFNLNGSTVDVRPRPDASLLDVLREDCGLRSMKDGCAPEGSCGACTVMIGGRAVVSCAQPASRAEGRTIVTLEGLDAATRDGWANAFTASGASQCGFCSPGIVMKAEALLGRVAEPGRGEIARSLAGNLCRCTGYTKVIDAIESVAEARRSGGALAVPAFADGVGERVGRYDGAALVLGEHEFVADMTVPGMLHGAIRFSDHPRALVRRIDTSRAATHPGVLAVVTWRDVPGERVQGLLTRDWPLLVAEGETTRYVGDALAAVAATTRHAAREAAALIQVDYEVLEPVTDPAMALADGAPLVHPSGNLLSTCVIGRGDVDAALAGAAHVATETFETQRIEHAFLEPEAALAVPGDEKAGEPALRVFSQGQGAWEDRRQIASILGLPETAVRVTQVATGGAFGGKEDLGAQGHAALLARVTGRPVLVAMSRHESLRFHPKRHPLTMTYTVGCDGDGRLVAVRARIVGDTGAYASVGAKVLERAAGHACGAYRVPNVDVEALTVYTNNAPCGAMRGFGVPQVTFALDGLLDVLAERVGIDRWEMRWRNALDVGDRTGTGQRLGPGVGLKRTLLAVRDAFRSARYAGIACGMKNTGIGNGVTERGRAILRPEADGTVTLFHSWSEMGQGIHTALRQIVCDELGLAADRVRVVVDTEYELDTGETTASRATTLGGRAVLEAARRLREALGSGRLEDFAGREFDGEFVVDWTTAPEGHDADPVTHLAYGWATQVVILDEAGRIERVIAAQDVGRAVNPLVLEGQMEGGVHMGLGYALSEAYDIVDGIPVAESVKSLGIIPPAGMPPVDCIIVEEPQPEGPYGAKGAGEAVLVPTAAAVA
ncbi:MAG TPA: selenium-dependent xanthine dehydrogenase, partial [Candidatus Limnocylindrales bacterium]|nr:selenium-dependent xanthine dehydrogenase [Candidatus Limnocylindrales bacterium]